MGSIKKMAEIGEVPQGAAAEGSLDERILVLGSIQRRVEGALELEAGFEEATGYARMPDVKSPVWQIITATIAESIYDCKQMLRGVFVPEIEFSSAADLGLNVAQLETRNGYPSKINISLDEMRSLAVRLNLEPSYIDRAQDEVRFIADRENLGRKSEDEAVRSTYRERKVRSDMKLEDTTGVSQWSFIMAHEMAHAYISGKFPTAHERSAKANIKGGETRKIDRGENWASGFARKYVALARTKPNFAPKEQFNR